MTKTELLIEKNNQLREQLTPENKEYYEDILIYIRTKSFFHSEEDVENLLMELLNDILEAQINGETAISYFGNNPQQSVDNLLKQLPKVGFKEQSSLLAIVFGISSFFSLFSSLTGPRPSINFLSLFVNFLITFIFIQGIFYIISSFSFSFPRKKRNKKEYLFATVYVSIFLGLMFISDYFGSRWLSISVPSYTGLIITWIAILLASGWILAKKETDFYYIIPTAGILLIMTTLQKLPWTANLFYSNTNKFIAAIITFVLVICCIYFQFKKTKQKD